MTLYYDRAGRFPPRTMSPRLLLALALALIAGAAAAGPEAEPARDYLEARDALRAGNSARYQTLRTRLGGHALSPFLDYEFLKDRVAKTPAAELHAFIEEHRAAWVSDALRRKWLHHLAERRDWATFLREAVGIEDDTELLCHRIARELRTERDLTSLMAQIERLWLTGAKQPGACDEPFETWRRAGYMKPEKVWARIQLAMEKRNLTLAESLARHLDAKERPWVERWLAMHRHPARELERLRYPVDTELARRIVRHGIMRVAQNDPAEAMRRWHDLRARHAFAPADEDYVHRWIGVLAAQRHLPQAVEWLSAAGGATDETLRQWRVRAAIRTGDWKTGLHFIEGLSEAEQKESQWRYWKAWMLEQTGAERIARGLYRELARERGYYGFLAADRLGEDYRIEHIAVQAKSEEITALLARQGLLLAHALYEAGDTVNARRQWNHAIRGLDNRELQVAALIASRWGWADRAILTLGKTDHLHDLELRFPLLYRELIEANARNHRLDADWVYGVLRQESAFMTDARSSAGALGLMQLMPRTGQLTARRLRVPLSGNQALLQVDTNVKLGAGYLRQVLDENRGHQILATASYNAGPHRVRQWLPEGAKIPAAAWIETIPFNETRNYVKNVMGFTTIYGWRLSGEHTRLRERMPEVSPAGEARVLEDDGKGI